MTKVQAFDRREEQRLLRAWVETTTFDREPQGIPPLAPEDDDEPPTSKAAR